MKNSLQDMQKKAHKLLTLAFLLLCAAGPSVYTDTSVHAEQPVYTEPPALPWRLLHSTPRSPDHFTQGLVYAGSQLFESTGHYGTSQLIAYDANTLKPQAQHFLDKTVFAEGLTALDNKLYQGSWKSGEIFVYDFALNLLRTLPVTGQVWGLTTDGHALIMSNGSSTLQFLDPATGQLLRTLAITDANGQPWSYINELEWVNGNILANVWHRDVVLVIDSNTGRITGQYDLAPLSQAVSQHLPNRDPEQVLNGIAWHSQTKTLLVTGKDWPLWFSISLSAK